MEFLDVVCPSCFEVFGVAAPPLEELPASMDYDCEICCRPMTLHFDVEDEEIFVSAQGLEE